MLQKQTFVLNLSLSHALTYETGFPYYSRSLILVCNEHELGSDSKQFNNQPKNYLLLQKFST